MSGAETWESRVGALLRDCTGDVNDTGEAPEGTEVVDCHVLVAIDQAKAEQHREELVELLEQWPTEAWGQPTSPLSTGPSYIAAGAVLGDQTLAFIMFAVGKVLGLWGVITPKTLGLTGTEAGQAAGNGFVMMGPYRSEAA